MGAPTVTGHVALATSMPALRATSHSAGTRRSDAYQYQPPSFFSNGSNTTLFTMPWRAGVTPVTRVACAGYVTVGQTLRTERACAPSS